jgi:glycosyltransferase involved in cell wall biosynthesis
MKNVGIVIRSLKPGGAEKQSAMLANVLCSNYRVFVFYQYHEFSASNKSLLKHDNIIKVHLKGGWLKKIWHLRKYCFKYNINCLFSYLSSDNLIASLATLGNKKCETYGGIRSSLLPPHKFIVLKYLHKYLQKASIFNNHTGQQQFVQKGFNASKSIVIPNTIDINKSTTNKNGQEVIKLLSVGRFVSAKDYDTALLSIKALSGLCTQKFKYCIVGFGEEEEQIRKMIANEQLSELVEIVINPDNVNDYYQMADIYLCTSVFEGLSNSIMEALNYQLPVVATDVGDNNQLVSHQHTGFLTPVKDYNTIAKHLNQLILNAELRNSMGENGYMHLKNNYSIYKFKERYIQLIENQ